MQQAISRSQQNPKNKSYWSRMGKKMMKGLQKLGGSLMFPIAVLPFAALLSRFGALATDLGGETGAAADFGMVLSNTAGAIFNNLPLIFAIGTAFGLSIDHRGEAALVGAILFLAINLLLSENGIANLLYRNVNTYSFTDSSGKTQHLSELLYVKTFGQDKSGNIVVVGGKYVLDIGVIGGITAGCISAYLYNKYKEIQIPKALAFFGGRRFIPMLALTAAIPLGFFFGAIWPWIQYGLIQFGNKISSSDAWAIPGAFLYALLNRIIQPFGIHHVINTFLWFQLPVENYLISSDGKIIITPELAGHDVANAFEAGNTQPLIDWINNNIINHGHFKNMPQITAQNWSHYFTWSENKIAGSGGKIIAGENGQAIIFGDITAFSQGMLSGNFQTGYFPMYWGGLPAAAAAMIMTSRPENRQKTSTFLIGVAIVAALTGIDEPVVFAFIFVGPILWAYNALFTACFAAIAIAMHMHVGFGFSAGLIDWTISLTKSIGMSKFEGVLNGTTYGVFSNPGWMFVLALVIAPIYYFSFYFTIKKMDIKTPGREAEIGDYVPGIVVSSGGSASILSNSLSTQKTTDEAKKVITQVLPSGKVSYEQIANNIIALIGIANFKKIDNCATRLRLIVKDNQVGTDAQWRSMPGIYGINRVGTEAIQIIIGTDVEYIADILHKKLAL